MTPTWHEAARAMRERDGLSYSEIGRRLGRTPGAVWKALHPERQREMLAGRNRDPAVRAAQDRARRPLCECGQPRSPRSERCAACLRAEWQRVRDTITRLWREGYTAAEIGAAIGWSRRSVHSRIARLRAAGVDLPHRRSQNIIEHARTLDNRSRAGAE